MRASYEANLKIARELPLLSKKAMTRDIRAMAISTTYNTA